MINLRWGAALAAVLLTTSACEKKATGQVVAVVNGEELSLTELNGELQKANLPEGADKKAVTAAAVQRLIDRKLLVQQAREQGLDKDPEYLKQQRRVNEDLLIGLLGKQATSTVGPPQPADVQKFMADNPAMFASRTVYRLDQLQFAAPRDPSVLRALEGDRSLDAVAATLQRLGIQAQRGVSSLDSAVTPPDVMRQVLALPRSEPFIVSANGRVFASVITGQQVVPLPSEQARAVATEGVRRQSFASVGEKRIKQLRTGAKIDYNPEYQPAAAGKAAATAQKK